VSKNSKYDAGSRGFLAKESAVVTPKASAGETDHGFEPDSLRLMRQKIASQDRLIARAQHMLRVVTDQLGAATHELYKLKARDQKRAFGQPDPNHPAQLISQQSQVTGEPSAAMIGELSQAHFGGLVAASQDHIFVLSQNGTYLFSNDRVQQFDLRKGTELVGKRLQDIYRPDVCQLYREKLKEVMDNSEAVTFHYQKTFSQGKQYHRDTLYPIYKGRAVWAVGGVCCNITQQKEIEKQLVQAQKMEALGTLVAGVAHEINNPINLMLFNLPLLEKMWQDLLPVLDAHAEEMPGKKIGGLPLDFVKQNLPRLISDMEMAANRVAHIVSGLKGFARKSNPSEKSDIHVNVAVQNAARLADATLKKSKATLALDLGEDLPPLHANLQNLEQIVLNLIINALESIGHDHGAVQIATKWIQENRTIAIEVSDNGRGINPQVAEKIFDPFVTDRQSVGGTGLGLSVTYNLVKAHKGDIFFKTRAGEGTRFSVVLPTDLKRKRYKVMVVDDDADFRKLIMRAVTRVVNCVVEDFSNGAEALIRMGSHPPDLLILDMFMPEMDGLGVCRAIKNELGLEQMKIIIVTGFPDHPNLYAAARMGFNQILTKPLTVEYFNKMVREALDEKFI
jgi:signal transduction histidine kinase/ActR/RegA family two-component response regulator